MDLATGVVIVSAGERVILAHNLQDKLHLGQLIKGKAHPLGGRGGGSANGAQVYFTDPSAQKEFLRLLNEELGQR
jgi:alanyl-tRNA synthetase